MSSAGSDVLGIDEIQKRTGLSVDSIYQGLAKGEIPGFKVGRRWLIPRGRFEAWFEGSGSGANGDKGNEGFRIVG